MRPPIQIVRALRSNLFARRRSWCAKRPRGHGRQPVWRPLGGKEPVPGVILFPLFSTVNSQRQLGELRKNNDLWQESIIFGG